MIKINKDADVIIFLGLSIFNKNNIGLKKIPPPIPTTPEINPKNEPMKILKNGFGFLILKFIV